MAGGGDGLEDDDPLTVRSYSQLLFSDEVDNISTDDCFHFTSTDHPPKMLCFGGEYIEELCDLGFDDDDDNKGSNNTTRNIAPKACGVLTAVTCSDSSSTSSTNNGDAVAKSLPKSNVSQLFNRFIYIFKENKKKKVWFWFYLLLTSYYLYTDKTYMYNYLVLCFFSFFSKFFLLGFVILCRKREMCQLGGLVFPTNNFRTQMLATMLVKKLR